MKSETQVQNEIRLAAAYDGLECWRNNVGACVDQNGRMIRYGLANDSKQLNERIKSSDLVLIRPVLITAAHIGMRLGVAGFIECKAEGWQFEKCYGKEKKRAEAQAAFMQIARNAGALAGFATCVDDYKRTMCLTR